MSMQMTTTDDQQWQAVSSRDRSSDGTFFYGVVTTGVYCRPSCASRLPNRENVRFFETAAAAEATGLRACKRCDPTGPGDVERRARLVAQACRTIEASTEPVDLDALAAEAGMSRFHFHRVFKGVTGLTPKGYAQAHRAERARDALGQQATVTDAIYAAGFGSNGRFYASSNERLGMTPSEFREGGAGVDVRFAVGQCSLGAILVAATDKGVCAIEFDDDPGALLERFQDRFHGARLVGDDPTFDELVAQVVGLVEQPGLGTDLPLDVRGTAFQERVWRALRDVPAGETTTYAEIARRIGAPTSFRAVAQACGANRLAVAIPCHRVIRTDGGLSGYRWGIERKQALLERERALR
jgi:AraC family transcriptional regulator of adaptative response/methylated-DNA-[protein]-cysteine methyltransferase